jgi:hypothetical protein
LRESAEPWSRVCADNPTRTMVQPSTCVEGLHRERTVSCRRVLVVGLGEARRGRLSAACSSWPQNCENNPMQSRTGPRLVAFAQSVPQLDDLIFTSMERNCMRILHAKAQQSKP